MSEYIKIKPNRDSSTATIRTSHSHIVGEATIGIEEAVEICKRQTCVINITEVERMDIMTFIDMISGSRVECLDRLYKRIKLTNKKENDRKWFNFIMNINNMTGHIKPEDTIIITEVIKEVLSAHNDSLKSGIDGDMDFAFGPDTRVLEFYIELKNNTYNDLIRKLGDKYEIVRTKFRQTEDEVICRGYVKMEEHK